MQTMAPRNIIALFDILGCNRFPNHREVLWNPDLADRPETTSS